MYNLFFFVHIITSFHSKLTHMLNLLSPNEIGHKQMKRLNTYPPLSIGFKPKKMTSKMELYPYLKVIFF